MSSSIKTLLNGIISMISTKSTLEQESTQVQPQQPKKEKKMFNFSSNVPELDTENERLFQASNFLERVGNNPGMTADEFFIELASSDVPADQHQSILMAAIAIETMMSAQLDPDSDPTVH